MSTCGEECEVYSRVCGYYRPATNWNKGKKEEFKERRMFRVNKHEKFYDQQMGVENSTCDVTVGTTD